MFKKFNWGHGITVFYICFVAVVVTALVASFGVDHSLVLDDYYAEDLAYQSTYNSISNNLESKNLDIKVEKEEVRISFKDIDNIQGTIYFYRASDKTKDFKHKISSPNEVISTKGLASGKWSLKISWSDGVKSYYKEEVIYI